MTPIQHARVWNAVSQECEEVANQARAASGEIPDMEHRERIGKEKPPNGCGSQF